MHVCVCVCVWQSSVVALEQFLSALEYTVRRQLSNIMKTNPSAITGTTAEMLCNGAAHLLDS